MDNKANSYQRFLEGDESAVAEIVRDYKDGLIYYVNSIVGSIHTAEDVAEDTFLKLMIKRPKDKGGSSFKTWLYTIARNEALNRLRRERRTVSTDEEHNVEDIADMEDLERGYIAKEQRLAVHRAMLKLKDEYRQVLCLVYFEDFSIKDAAAVMHKSVHAVETLVYRARLALKAELLKEGFTYEEL